MQRRPTSYCLPSGELLRNLSPNPGPVKRSCHNQGDPEPSATRQWLRETSVAMAKKKVKVPPGKKLIFRPTITVKGKIRHAWQYGIRAFPILVDR